MLKRNSANIFPAKKTAKVVLHPPTIDREFKRVRPFFASLFRGRDDDALMFDRWRPILGISWARVTGRDG